MAHPISHQIVRVAGPAEQFQDRLDHLAVAPLAIRADQVGLPDPSPLQDQQHRGAVVVGVDPVPDVEPGPVELGAAAVEHVGDLARNELLDVLIGP